MQIKMLELVHKNYMKSYSTDSYFKVEVEGVNNTHKSYLEESKSVAEMLWSDKIGSIYFFYSGGKDSEFAMTVFLSLKMNVIPTIISTRYNQHDVKYAFDFCNKHKLNPLIIEEDYDKFVNSDNFLDVYRHMNSAAYHHAIKCHWMSKLDGTIVSGDGNPWIKKGHDNNWYSYEPEAIHTLTDYFTNKNLYGTPFFLQYTASQMLAFLEDPVIKDLANNRVPGKLGSETSKIKVYTKDNDFEIIPRPKYHGYEEVEKNKIFDHPNMIFVRNNKEKYWRNCFLEYHTLIDALKNGNKMTVYDSNICD